MRRFGILGAFCLLVSTAFAGVEDAIVKLSGGGGVCSGVIVEPSGVILSAKHCGFREVTADVPNVGRVSAKLVRQSSDVDGTSLFQIQEPGQYAHLSIAQQAPKIGDKVYSLGHPGGSVLHRNDGTVIGFGVAKEGARMHDVTITDLGIRPGWSGGPLLNERNEVVGILSTGAFSVDRAGNIIGWSSQSCFISHADVMEVYSGPATPVTPKQQPKTELVRVVVFGTSWCGPCRRLKRDYEAGHFPGYKFEFINYEEGGHILDEFMQECRPGKDLSLPLIWVPGSGDYREGYDQPRGLLSWIADACRFIVAGPPPKIKVIPIPELQESLPQQPQAKPEPQPTPTDQSSIKLDKIADDLAKTMADVKAFKEAGVIGKLGAINELRKDKEVLLKHVNDLRSDPRAAFSAFFGVLLAVVRRRFLA